MREYSIGDRLTYSEEPFELNVPVEITHKEVLADSKEYPDGWEILTLKITGKARFMEIGQVFTLERTRDPYAQHYVPWRLDK